MFDNKSNYSTTRLFSTSTSPFFIFDKNVRPPFSGYSTTIAIDWQFFKIAFQDIQDIFEYFKMSYTIQWDIIHNETTYD